MPYGYPSGHSLRQMLIDPSLFNPLLEKSWFERDDINEFCRAFMLSGMKSIDAFLARRGKDFLGHKQKTIEQVGKHGIALALRQNKSLDTLFQNPDPIVGFAISIRPFVWSRVPVGRAIEFCDGSGQPIEID